jgi:glucose/mannose-6-phosphate isomerase
MTGAGTLSALDDEATLKRVDREGLLQHIEGLPEQCAEAWERARAISAPAGADRVRNVALLGMGGSAIAGDILRSLASLSSTTPVAVVRGYDVPATVGEGTLVIACSHSGDTEETLSAFDQALSAGAQGYVITKGGALLTTAQERAVPSFTYRFEGGPRSAIGHQLMALLALGERLGLLDSQDGAVSEAVALMRGQRERLGFAVPAERNDAKQLAGRLQGRLPVVVGAGVLREAAYRWKTQFNENSKSWAVFEELPEMDHNSIVGFGLPQHVARQMHVVFLSHPGLHPRVLLRIDGTGDALRDAGVTHERVDAKGASPLAQVLTGILAGDFTSYYLALLYGVDPSPVEPITKLKQRLAR